jgi:hypothetical protein
VEDQRDPVAAEHDVLLDEIGPLPHRHRLGCQRVLRQVAGSAAMGDHQGLGLGGAGAEENGQGGSSDGREQPAHWCELAATGKASGFASPGRSRSIQYRREPLEPEERGARAVGIGAGELIGQACHPAAAMRLQERRAQPLPALGEAPRLEPAGPSIGGSVPPDGIDQCRHALAGQGGQAQHRGPPVVGAGCGMAERCLDLALGAGRDLAEIGLADDDDVGNLDDTGLDELQTVARGRLDDEDDRVGELTDLRLRLADPHRLDDDDVEQRPQHHHQRNGGIREPAQPLARGQRPDEAAGVVRIELEPGPVTEQGTPGPSRGRVDGEHGHRLPGIPVVPDQPGEQRRLADAGRPGEPDHLALGMPIGLIQQRPQPGPAGLALEVRQRSGDQGFPALADGLEIDAAVGRPAHASRSAAWAAARRAIGTR